MSDVVQQDNSLPQEEHSNAATQAAPRDEAVAFSEEFIRSFPRSNRKVSISVMPFGLKGDPDKNHEGTSLFISPHGIEFQAARDFKAGSLLKIEITIPDYWERKMKVVEYRRIDRPENFRILAKVMKVEDIGKRGRKKHVIAQTVNLEPCDDKVLRAYLQEG